MAYCRLGHIKENVGNGSKSAGLYKCIDYIFNPAKTNDQKYVGGYNINIGSGNITKNVYEKMLDTKDYFGKLGGRQGYHYKLSFAETDSISPETALEITNIFCEKCFGDYECVYAVHDNTEHMHSHIVFNSIDMIDGLKYQYKKGDWAKKIMPVANSICKEYGLSELDLSLDDELRLQHKCKSYNKWIRDNKPGTPKKRTGYTNAMIRRDIDECIAAAASFDDFKILMQKKGHIIDDTKKHMTILAPNRSRACRTYVLTPDKQTYTKENIIRMINGTYLNKEELMEKMMQDWNSYYTQKVRRHTKRMKPEIARLVETKNFQQGKKLFSAVDIADYRSYLNQVDKELNIIKKHVAGSLEARAEVLLYVDEAVMLAQYEKRFNEGDVRFTKEHQRFNYITEKISEKGYSLKELYDYKKKGEQLIAGIDDFKKHIFVERKICDRLEKEIIPTRKKQTR